MNLKEFKDCFAKEAFGITKEEAIAQNICIDCKKLVDYRIKTEAGKKEYQISGMCEICWDEMFQDE